MKEVERGGQVFYLHNRIESLESVRLFLEKILPEVMIETAHGRMSAEELDEKMHRFINNNFQVLLSTTIIESGIDIPNVNTIIIDRAAVSFTSLKGVSAAATAALTHGSSIRRNNRFRKRLSNVCRLFPILENWVRGSALR